MATIPILEALQLRRRHLASKLVSVECTLEADFPTNEPAASVDCLNASHFLSRDLARTVFLTLQAQYQAEIAEIDLKLAASVSQ